MTEAITAAIIGSPLFIIIAPDTEQSATREPTLKSIFPLMMINELAKQGIGIIMISSELPEVLQVANNIVVFAAGKVTGRLENKDLTQDILLDYATSQKAV